jgi:hypothetical protein
MFNSNWKPRERPSAVWGAGAWKKMADDMYDWAKELEQWGIRVRRDIVALEEQRDFMVANPGLSSAEYAAKFVEIYDNIPTTLQADDPGPPPAPPWKKR